VAGRSVRLHPEAERDLEEGLRFYLSRSTLAAERFLAEVEAALVLLQEAPERWPIFRRGTRRFVMGAYPYSIVYRALDDEIHVIAVAHAKRRAVCPLTLAAVSLPPLSTAAR
jgi:plasmid stabilization system protein ParE